jgi:putative ABC transport system substrate-binding protein
MTSTIRRREFITLLGSTATAWPFLARAQQPAMPVIGFLHLFSSVAIATGLAAFRNGLSQAGYLEGHNLRIEFRSAENQSDRLPVLAADLVRAHVTAIYAGSAPAALAAKTATTIIPIVFAMGEDPVKEGVVSQLNRPGGNVTGFTDFGNQVFGKRLGLLHEIVPRAAPFALLVNPDNANAEPDAKEAQVAANALGRDLKVFRARTETDLDTAFAAINQQRLGALIVGVDGFFFERREQITTLAARYRILTVYERREYPAAGGLISYGSDRLEMNRLAGIYVGRILKGEKPADLPVQQSTKFTLILNLKTARALGVDIPPSILAIADEVIE